MKVRLLSGNQRGHVQDLEQTAADVAIQTGYAEAFVEEVAPVVQTPVPAPEPKPRRTRAAES